MQNCLIENNLREVKKRNRKEYLAEYRQKNKDKIKLKGAEYCQNHKDEIKVKNAEYRKSHKNERKEYYQKNKEKIKLKNAEDYQTHKDEVKFKSIEYYQSHKDEINAKYRNIKINLIQVIGNKCQGDKCDIEYNGTNGAIFQFHHIDPKTKSFKLSGRNLSTHSWDEVLDEAKKCELLCANCHSLEHTVDKPRSLNSIKIRNKKVELIQAIGNKCQGDNCNIEYDGTNVALFQFHHIDPQTKLFQFSGSNLIDHTWNEVLDEASKCKLLCANCHKKIHSRNS